MSKISLDGGLNCAFGGEGERIVETSSLKDFCHIHLSADKYNIHSQLNPLSIGVLKGKIHSLSLAHSKSAALSLLSN